MSAAWNWFVRPVSPDVHHVLVNYHIVCVVTMKAPAAGDDCCGAVFGDDGGAGIFLAGLQRVAGVDGGGEFLAVE